MKRGIISIKYGNHNALSAVEEFGTAERSLDNNDAIAVHRYAASRYVV